MWGYRDTLRVAGKVAAFAIVCASVAAGWTVLDYGRSSHLSMSRVVAASKPTFNDDVAPILQKSCLPCHSAARHKAQLVTEDYASLMKGGEHGKTVVPGNADGSRIIGMLEGKIRPRMPEHADPLPAEQIATIKAWIDAGAEGPKN
jgi:Planctomycete cytochrome C